LSNGADRDLFSAARGDGGLLQGLEYPVGLDNDFVAWNAYGNRYWPTMYLIDRAGQIRYTQIGEGNYGRTEAAIRALLAEAVDPAAETEAAS
jgi:hypothetical protein